MSHKAVETLMDRWINEPSFREEIRRNPEKAVLDTGVELSDEEWAALRQVDWSLSDEELQTRSSKISGII